ncbi:MAG: GNAT family N-acetyltransferase [Chloroflexota bacterium]
MEGTLSVELARGDAAIDRIGDPGYLVAWERLHAACPWATSFQSPAFADAWYRLHEPLHEPVLVESRDGNGELVGLLPLARHRPGRRLVGVGGIHAEYQGWLSTPAATELFPPAALERLEREFPRGRVHFNYLAPGTPTAWTARDARWPGRIRLATRHRGLMDLSDPSAIEASLRKGHNRSRMNTLRRVGEVSLETITSVDALEAVIDEIGVLCDLRQGAVNDSLPFRNNPLKRPLHLALMERGLLHVTILRVGGAIASAHLDMRNGDEVLIYLITHSPFLARQSPGSLHILLLGQQLADLGFTRFDLSPGSGYKDRFATVREPIQRMSVQFGIPDRIAADVSARAVSVATRVLAATGRTPAGARHEIRRLGARAATAVRRLPARDAPDAAYAVLRLPDRAPGAGSEPLAVDCLGDLLAFDPDRFGGLPLVRFLALAVHRLELGHHVLTRLDGNALAECWWAARLAIQPSPETNGRAPDSPRTALLVYDPFLSSRPPGSLTGGETLDRVASVVDAMEPASAAYLAVAGRDGELVQVLTRCGASHLGDVRIEARAGHPGSAGPDGLLEQLSAALRRGWQTGPSAA